MSYPTAHILSRDAASKVAKASWDSHLNLLRQAAWHMVWIRTMVHDLIYNVFAVDEGSTGHSYPKRKMKSQLGVVMSFSCRDDMTPHAVLEELQ